MATGQYDDAWETPGWTAQNFAYPPSDEIVLNAPEGLRNVEITGTFFDQHARPAWGVFTFTPSIRSVQVGDATVVLQPFRVQLSHGRLDKVNILAPGVDAVVDPEEWTWAIRQRVGTSIREYAVAVPLTGDTIDVKDLPLP